MCGREEVEGDESHNPVDKLEAAKSQSHWNIQERSKRVDSKGELEVVPGEKRYTRDWFGGRNFFPYNKSWKTCYKILCKECFHLTNETCI